MDRCVARTCWVAALHIDRSLLSTYGRREAKNFFWGGTLELYVVAPVVTRKTVEPQPSKRRPYYTQGSEEKCSNSFAQGSVRPGCCMAGEKARSITILGILTGIKWTCVPTEGLDPTQPQITKVRNADGIKVTYQA